MTDATTHLSFLLRQLVTAVAIMAVTAAGALAQEELNDDREIKTHKPSSQTMSEIVYKRLGSIHELMGEEQYEKALQDLGKMPRLRLNDHEKALVEQTYGFLYVQLDRYTEALDSFEKSLSYEALPGAATQGMMYSLAGLYASEGRYMDSIRTMRKWFQYEEDPVPEAYMVIASGFAELQRYIDALPYVKKAIAKADNPKEEWYMLELAIYIEKSRYRDAAALLRRMLQIWPEKPKYWDLLASIYMELKQDDNALHTLMVAYRNGLIEDKSKLIAIVQLNLLQEIPYAAATILETEIENGNIEANKKNLDMQLAAWIDAKAYDKAVETARRLVELTGDGDYYMRIAGIYNERGDWPQVIEAAQNALENGVEDPASVHMYAGMAYVEIGKLGDAEREFLAVQRLGKPKQRQNAAEWLSFVAEKASIASAR